MRIIMDLNGWDRTEPFLQIGGDISAKEGWRIAVSLIYQQMKDKEQTMEIVKKLQLCSEPECKVILAMADRKMNAVTSTSAGRLFDAVSAILGIRTKSTFEGEASMALEFAAEAYEKEMREVEERMDSENNPKIRREETEISDEGSTSDMKSAKCPAEELVSGMKSAKIFDKEKKEMEERLIMKHRKPYKIPDREENRRRSGR